MVTSTPAGPKESPWAHTYAATQVIIPKPSLGRLVPPKNPRFLLHPAVEFLFPSHPSPWTLQRWHICICESSSVPLKLNQTYNLPLFSRLLDILTLFISSTETFTKIALISRQNEFNITPPQEKDFQWWNFTKHFQLNYIPTTTSFSKQGGHNYASNSLIDGFFIKTLSTSTYTCATNTSSIFNTSLYTSQFIDCQTNSILKKQHHENIKSHPCKKDSPSKNKILWRKLPKNRWPYNILQKPWTTLSWPMAHNLHFFWYSYTKYLWNYTTNL